MSVAAHLAQSNVAKQGLLERLKASRERSPLGRTHFKRTPPPALPERGGETVFPLSFGEGQG